MKKRVEAPSGEGGMGEEMALRVTSQGTVVIPREAVLSLRLKPGEPVHVRVSAPAVSAALARRGMGIQEIDAIAALQAEPAAHVVRLLLAEGAFRKRRRTGSGVRRRRG
jgi:bifunctional DNA-binding transcriptional regulator/antitoxin component of YhaV-PrlF toxin-antitoxin module